MKNHHEKIAPETSHFDSSLCAADHLIPGEPASILREALPLLPRGRALDAAAGKGANAIFLAELGWRVTAIDVSAEALEQAVHFAQERRISAVKMQATDWLSNASRAGTRVRAGLPPPRGEGVNLSATKNLVLVQMDLETCRLPPGQFHVVLCFRYLQRLLFPLLERALCPGGVLIYETYTTEHLQFGGRPRNPEFLLRPGELREAFPLLEPIFYREFAAGKGLATFIAAKAARSNPKNTRLR